MWSMEKLKNEAKHLIWPDNLTLLISGFFLVCFSGIDSEQKVGTSIAITMVQCMCSVRGKYYNKSCPGFLVNMTLIICLLLIKSPA